MEKGSVLIEAIVVGFVIAFILYLLQRFDTMKQRNIWVQIFISGFLGHLIFEALGINRWYCRHGAACAAASVP